MKKIVIILLSLFIAQSTVHAQKGIDFNRIYAAGGTMHMFLDSSAKNVFYAMGFNQPRNSFNYLPEVHTVSIRLNFRKTDSVQFYRYTILEDNKPIVVNKSINIAQLKKVDVGDEEVYRSITFGVFPIKDKIITIVTYDLQRPQNVFKTVFYGKSIPKAKITGISKRFKTDLGVDYKWITDPKERVDLTINEKDEELSIFKDISDFDYLYYASIKDKKTNKIIFESTSWRYGGVISKDHEPLPFISIDKSVFKKSGDYEIIIQPSINWTNCLDCDISPNEIEKHASRYTLSITLAEESYTKKELLIFIIIVSLSIGLIFLIVLYFVRKRNKKKLAEKEQQTNIAKLKLNSVRSQLNPHFLFNALSGIQNLMNKNEIDSANKYLSKFARLTRNVLDDKELISLSQEKTLIDDYLQMEQLRFGFTYEISHSESLDLDNIEIPSMLLQPFVENAVKHGISQKASEGKISILFYTRVKDLILSVTDNGNGFGIEKASMGLGLPLSNSRIELLNSIYTESRLSLDIRSNTGGTVINLILTDWL